MRILRHGTVTTTPPSSSEAQHFRDDHSSDGADTKHKAKEDEEAKKALLARDVEKQLAEEQRLMDEKDRAEHDAQIAEMERCAV